MWCLKLWAHTHPAYCKCSAPTLHVKEHLWEVCCWLSYGRRQMQSARIHSSWWIPAGIRFHQGNKCNPPLLHPAVCLVWTEKWWNMPTFYNRSEFKDPKWHFVGSFLEVTTVTSCLIVLSLILLVCPFLCWGFKVVMTEGRKNEATWGFPQWSV